MRDDDTTGGYFCPPFTIHINYRRIFFHSGNPYYALFNLIHTILHEWMHFFQFIIIAHCDINVYETSSYLKMTEHQAYYLNYIIAKFMGIKYNLPHMVKVAWDEIDEDLYGDYDE